MSRLWLEIKRAFERSLGWRPTDEDYESEANRLQDERDEFKRLAARWGEENEKLRARG